MKALVYQGPELLSYEEFEIPKAKNDDVLVKVHYVGICGSDMHAYLGHDERRPAPLILGHEAAGIVAEGRNEGQRVTINPLVACNQCRYCQRRQKNLCENRQILSMPPRHGAFAEFVRVPCENLVEVPADFPLDKASLCEPLACGWHAVQKTKSYLGDNFADAKALVIGGGAIGVGAALALKANGIKGVELTEPNEERALFIRQHLELEVLNAVNQQERSYQIVIDGVGIEPTRKLASAVIAPGGVITHIGLGSAEGGLDIRTMTLQEIAFIGTYTYTAEDFVETANAMFSGALGSLDLFEIRNLENGAEAFTDIRSGTVAHPKIILKT